MMIGYFRPKAILAALLLTFTLALPAQAEELAARASTTSLEKPLFTRIAFEAFWGVFKVADVTFSLDTQPEAYKTDMTIRPAGVVSWFTDNFSADLISQGTFVDGGLTKPNMFRRTWKSDKKQGEVIIDYDPKTGIALGSYDGKPDEKVKPDMRRNVIDPLAVLTAARHRMLMGEGVDLGLKVYDGKRRFDMKGQVGRVTHIEFRNEPYRIMPVVLQFVPLAGFNKKQHDGWMGSNFEIMFTTDGNATPFQIFLETKLGWLKLFLRDTCTVQQGECQLSKASKES